MISFSGRTNDSNSEDESFDNVSVYSHMSEVASSEATDELANERFEEKFEKALEQATEKSAQTRVQALQAICELLMHRYMLFVIVTIHLN